MVSWPCPIVIDPSPPRWPGGSVELYKLATCSALWWWGDGIIFVLDEFLTRCPWHEIVLLRLANGTKKGINQPGKLGTLTGKATWYVYVWCGKHISLRIFVESQMPNARQCALLGISIFYSGSTLSLLILRCICDGCHLDRPQRLKRGPPELKAWVSTAKEPGSEIGCKRLSFFSWTSHRKGEFTWRDGSLPSSQGFPTCMEPVRNIFVL